MQVSCPLTTTDENRTPARGHHQSLRSAFFPFPLPQSQRVGGTPWMNGVVTMLLVHQAVSKIVRGAQYASNTAGRPRTYVEICVTT